MTKPIIFKNVCKSYLTAPHKWAINDFSLEIQESEFFCLIGPSGCGKSTILKLISGLEEPSSGTIIKPEIVGMVFQSGALLPWLSVEENTSLGLKMIGTPKYTMKKTTDKYLDMVSLTEYKNKYPRELSGGQRQRVGIARALTIQPKVLLLDEPFSSLDTLTTAELHKDILKIWQDTKITILMVSHLIEEAVILADRVGIMSEGKLQEIVDIDLPKPRNDEDENFLRVTKRIRELFHRFKQ